MVRYYFLLLSCLSLVVSDDSIAFPCSTPNEDIGVCISLFACPVLQKSLGTSSPSAIKFVKKSVCNKWAFKDLRVCCGKLGNFAEANNTLSTTILDTKNAPVSTNTNVTKTILNQTATATDKQAYRDFVIKKLLPTTTYCGLQHTDDRFYNESDTALDEFPWLAHVIFSDVEVDGEDPEEYADRCNGVLINRRYVLTNGYCARNPVKVRLGQYHTNKTISCVDNPNFAECTEPTIEVRIEEEIHMVDEQYNGWYEFALFRLSKNVSYTDFIRPICLPLHDPRKSAVHDQLIFSGWGAADQAGIGKKRMTYNTTNVEDCYKLADDLKETSVNASLICLAPQEGATDLACAGDEGSPLMYSYNFQWFADAIITKVYTEPGEDCSNKKPIDGIRITPKAVEWILDTIRP